MFKSSDSAFKYINDRLYPLRKSVEFDILFRRTTPGVRFICVYDETEKVLYISDLCVKGLSFSHFVQYWIHLSQYGHMEHKETQSQSKNKVVGSGKDYGSRFAANLFCNWNFW